MDNFPTADILDAYERTPMPDMPPIRIFELTTIDARTGDDFVDVIHAHAVDFTTAGGIFYTRMTPEYVEMNGERGWTVTKRIVVGFSSYVMHRELFDVPSSLTLN